eukprot:215963_1
MDELILMIAETGFEVTWHLVNAGYIFVRMITRISANVFNKMISSQSLKFVWPICSLLANIYLCITGGWIAFIVNIILLSTAIVAGIFWARKSPSVLDTSALFNDLPQSNVLRVRFIEPQSDSDSDLSSVPFSADTDSDLPGSDSDLSAIPFTDSDSVTLSGSLELENEEALWAESDSSGDESVVGSDNEVVGRIPGLTLAEISRFPTNLVGLGRSKQCMVCLAPMTSDDCIRRLPCMHTFHVNCIDRWLLHQSRCPV